MLPPIGSIVLFCCPKRVSHYYFFFFLFFPLVLPVAFPLWLLQLSRDLCLFSPLFSLVAYSGQLFSIMSPPFFSFVPFFFFFFFFCLFVRLFGFSRHSSKPKGMFLSFNSF
ncbi:hypothetical protein DFJ73DRAFT_393518 [Zopfochytrium polystomum]|nr:hypothetical protein DFJ73DRAFT_393518 [Zopfochytrium polystomum]